MKKVYMGEEFLSSLYPVLKTPDKGIDIIFNTLPFPGYINKDSEVRQQALSHQEAHDFQNSLDKSWQ